MFMYRRGTAIPFEFVARTGSDFSRFISVAEGLVEWFNSLVISGVLVCVVQYE
jgi:hypothetical protein